MISRSPIDGSETTSTSETTDHIVFTSAHPKVTAFPSLAATRDKST